MSRKEFDYKQGPTDLKRYGAGWDRVFGKKSTIHRRANVTYHGAWRDLAKLNKNE